MIRIRRFLPRLAARGTLVPVLLGAATDHVCAQALADVRGLVLNSATRAPVAGVTVRLQETSQEATTGADGEFAIRSVRPALPR